MYIYIYIYIVSHVRMVMAKTYISYRISIEIFTIVCAFQGYIYPASINFTRNLKQ